MDNGSAHDMSETDTTLEQICDAALQVYLRGGVGAISPESVAEELSVPLSAVSQHVDSAAMIRRELLFSIYVGAVPDVEAAVQRCDTGEAALEAMLTTYLRYSLSHMAELRYHLSLTQPGVPQLCEFEEELIKERLLPLNERLLGGVEAKLIEQWGEGDLPQGIHPRRLVFVAYLAAMGMIAMRAITDWEGGGLRHDDDDMIAEMTRTFASPTVVMRQLAALNDVAAELTSFRDEEALCERVAPLLCTSLEVERGFLVLLDEGGVLRSGSIGGLDAGTLEQVIAVTRDDRMPPPPHYRRCVEQGRTIVVVKPSEDPDWPASQDATLARQFSTLHPDAPFVVTPVRSEGEIIGALAGHMTDAARVFDRRDVARLETFATMVGLALANVRFYATLNAKVEERTRSLREAQAALVQSEKMAALGQLVAGVAHEINTPIGAVVSGSGVAVRALEMVRDSLGEEALQDRKLQRALKILEETNETNRIAGERITERVTALRNFARLDEAERKSADIHQGIDNTLMILRSELGHRVEVIKRYGELPHIDCFPNQLNQVFMNLLVNGLHAIDGKGSITIATSLESDEVLVKISDTGSGIADEDIPKIFDPGFTRKGVGVGTGLGLSICYQIMEHHQGAIEVDSELGVGSCFTVRIPCARH
jgi:signal transduction histidine kinase